MAAAPEETVRGTADVPVGKLGRSCYFFRFSPHQSGIPKNVQSRHTGEQAGGQLLLLSGFSGQQPGHVQTYRLTLNRLMNVKGAERAFSEGYTPSFSEVFLAYGLKKEVRFRAGQGAPGELISRPKNSLTRMEG